MQVSLGSLFRSMKNWAVRMNAACNLDDGFIYRKRGEFAKAIAAFTEVIRFTPQCVDAYAYRGYTQYELGQFEKTITDLTEAIRLDPACTLAYFYRGYACIKTERYEEAIAKHQARA